MATQIAQATATTIGNMTESGGIAAAFDSNTNQGQSAGAYKTAGANGVAYVGKQYAAGHIVVQWKTWASNDAGYNGNGNQTLSCRYSDNGSAWTEADSVVVSGTTNGQTVDRTFASVGSHAYWSVFFKSAGSSYDARMAEVQFWEVATYSLTAAAGALTLTGVAQTLKHGFYMAAAAGAFTLTGVAAALKQAIHLTAAVGSFVLSGIDTGLQSGKGMVAEVGTFVLTGVDATINAVRTMAAAAGTFTLTGVDAVLKQALYLTAAGASYLLTGIAAAVTSARNLTAATGTFTLTGIAILFHKVLHLIAAPGNLILTGFTVLFHQTRNLTAATGSYIVTGVVLALAEFVAPANKFRIRLQNYVLAAIRQTPPTLGQ